MIKELVIPLVLLSLIVITAMISGCTTTKITGAITGCHKETRPEKYTTEVKGCDQMEGCRCLHKSFLGLGACDSCECIRYVEVQVCE